MKGHTIIELKDVNTGKIKRFDDDNMLTNALTNFFKQGGCTNPSAFNNSNIRNSALEYLMGGVLLLDDTITEDVANVRVPAGIEMVANGAVGITNSDVPTELGSYNSVESGWQQDGTLKMVWDWTTSQGNGTIKSVCLTSKYMGLRGIGNSEGSVSNSLNTGTYNSETTITGTSGSVIGIQGNTLYTLSQIGNGESEDITGVTLRKYRVPQTSLDIRDKMNEPQLISEDTITFTTPLPKSSDIYYGYGWLAELSANYIHILFWFKNRSNERIIWNGGTPLYYRKINLANNAVTEHDITTTSLSLDSYEDNVVIGLNKDYIVFDKYLIETSGFTLESQVADQVTGVRYARYDGNGRWFITGNGKYIYDFNAGTCKPLNASSDEYHVSTEMTPLLISAGDCILRDPRYIATINNLSAPVVKTGDKTMKVTYILSF
jgi:hypothetical protein